MISPVVFYAFGAVVSLYFIKVLWGRRHLYALAQKLNGPLSLPIIGHSYLFLRGIEEVFSTLAKTCENYPNPVMFWMGPKPLVAFTDVIHVEKIISSMKFAQKEKSYLFMKLLLGDGLISASGPKWKAHRRVLAPLFAPKLMEKYFPIMVEHTELLIKIMKREVGKGAFRIDKTLHRCVTDIVNESFMGIKSYAQNGEMDTFLETVLKTYTSHYTRMIYVWLHNDFMYDLLGDGKAHKANVALIHRYFKKCLENAKNQQRSYEINNSHFVEQPQSILNQILAINSRISNFATEDDLVHHLTTFYQASEDTIAHVSTLTLILLGMYPEVQAKVYHELQCVFGETQRRVELSDLPKLKYLDMCIKEALRLFPIAPFILRESTENVLVDKWTIPKGTSVLISIYTMHRSADHWEKPHDFYPEHFLPETAKQRHPIAFIPFSSGPRGCIGKPYAYMTIHTILSTILQHYRIEADGTLQDKALKADISVRFKDDQYLIRLKERV